ncbi:MAG: hypothetical protein ACI9JD_004551, partial [Rhodococcus sp. (in: high G+C Gram-positive bacteria)]
FAHRKSVLKSRGGQTSLENPDRQLQKQIFADGDNLAVRGPLNLQIRHLRCTDSTSLKSNLRHPDIARRLPQWRFTIQRTGSIVFAGIRRTKVRCSTDE